MAFCLFLEKQNLIAVLHTTSGTRSLHPKPRSTPPGWVILGKSFNFSEPWQGTEDVSLGPTSYHTTSPLFTWAALAFFQPASEYLHVLFFLPEMFSPVPKLLPRQFLHILGQMSLLQGSLCWLLTLDQVHYSFIPLNLTFIVPLQFTTILFL